MRGKVNYNQNEMNSIAADMSYTLSNSEGTGTKLSIEKY